MKRLVLALTMAALLVALISTVAEAQSSWYWCWDPYYGYWTYCYY
jgi:hypothetical protein